MSLTLAQTRAMLTSFNLFDLDMYDGEAPTDTQKTAVVNWAIRTVAKQVFLFDNNIIFTMVASQSDYQMDSVTPWAIGATTVKMHRIRRVFVNGAVLTDYFGKPGLWTMEQQDTDTPSWRSLTASNPVKGLMVRGQQYLRVWPSPTSAVVSAAQNYVSGQYLPKDMTVVTDDAVALPLMEDVHEAVAYLAAYRYAMPNASEQEGWQRLGAYNKEWMDIVKEWRRDNINTQDYIGSTEAGETADMMFV